MKALKLQLVLTKIALDYVWPFTPVALGFVMLAFSPLEKGNRWWHLKLGELITS